MSCSVAAASIISTARVGVAAPTAPAADGAPDMDVAGTVRQAAATSRVSDSETDVRMGGGSSRVGRTGTNV